MLHTVYCMTAYYNCKSNLMDKIIYWIFVLLYSNVKTVSKKELFSKFIVIHKRPHRRECVPCPSIMSTLTAMPIRNIRPCVVDRSYSYLCRDLLWFCYFLSLVSRYQGFAFLWVVVCLELWLTGTYSNIRGRQFIC